MRLTDEEKADLEDIRILGQINFTQLSSKDIDRLHAMIVKYINSKASRPTPHNYEDVQDIISQIEEKEDGAVAGNADDQGILGLGPLPDQPYQKRT